MSFAIDSISIGPPFPKSYVSVTLLHTIKGFKALVKGVFGAYDGTKWNFPQKINLEVFLYFNL